MNKCTIKEINLDDIENQIKNIPKEQIFDPDSFIEKNYGNNEENIIKSNLSIEDLGSKFEKIDINNQKEEELLQSKEYTNNNTQDNIERIYNENDTKKQKKELNELINKIKKMSIEEIMESNKEKANIKLDIVLDLDNTCIFAFPIGRDQIMTLRGEFPNKDFKSIMFHFERQYMFSAFIVRNGLKEFFDYTKNFCNYYINTLGCENYGLEIKKFLENRFDIKFCGYKGRKENENTKSLKDLKLSTKNTVIFDDKPVWKKDNQNVIISKKFTDREINLKESQRKNLQNSINSFLDVYRPFLYYSSSPLNWKEQNLKDGRLCPFYDFKKLICFNGEYLESTKFQFIYMQEIAKIIYYLVYNSNIDVPKALKLIRYNIFYNSYFNLNYSRNNGINALEDIIVNCGGIIYNENNKKEYDNMKYFFVCNQEDYPRKKDEIKKDKRGKENCKVVSDKYILNSFYFMTNLEDELNNPQYRLDINDEDDFGNY